MDETFRLVMLFRIGERLTLSVIVLVLSVVVLVAFWRSVQRIDFEVSRDKVGAAGTVVLATPVFLLLTLIGYAFVSLSNPITVDVAGGAAPEAGAARAALPAGAFTGAVNEGPAAGKPLDNEGFHRQRAVERVRSLNCLDGEVAKLSNQVQDHFAETKLALLEPVWADGWGSFGALRDYVLARSAQQPDAAALKVFQERRQICGDL